MPPELNELCDLCEPFRDELDFVLDIDITERITYQADSLIQKRFPEDLYLRQVRDYLNQPQTAYPNKIFMILADPAGRDQQRSGSGGNELRRLQQGSCFIGDSGSVRSGSETGRRHRR